MRIAALALVSACALAACNPSGPTAPSAPGDGAFPNLFQTAYRAEAVITAEDGSTMPVVMIRDGNKQRMEMTTPQGQSTIITNGDTGETLMITSAGGQVVAMRVGAEAGESDPAREWSADMVATATRTGACSAAGESGSEWTREDNGETHAACVTGDGVILRSAVDGRTVWETTRIQRGPQSADLFVAPPGVQVMDMSSIGAAVRESLERAGQD